MTAVRRLRVLHLIDGLDGGGSERLLLDEVRLSDGRFVHRVTTMYRESARQVGPFVHAARLRELGAYRDGPRPIPAREGRILAFARSAIVGSGIERFARFVWTVGTVTGPGSFRALRELVRFRPDVLHAHLYQGFVCGLLLTRLTGRPLVHTVPAMAAQMRDVPWMPGLYARFHPLVARFFTDYPDELRRLGVPEKKIQWIRGSVDLEPADAAYERRLEHRSEIRAGLHLAADAPIALSVGRLHPSKGHDLAARAIAALADRFPALQWVVLGEGPERGRLEALVRELGIVERTHLRGFTPDVLPWYAAADLYLRTPVLEAENLSSRQAMAMGLPVVGFETGAPTELLRLVGHGALAANGDAAQLAEAIARVLGSEDGGRALGLRGREYARQELGVRKTFALYADAYEALGRRNARR